jgi:hypothetical protein
MRAVRRALLVGVVVASAAFLVILGSGTASGVNAQTSLVFRGPGIVLRYPSSLYVSNRTLDSMTNPVQRFVLSTYRVPGNRPNAEGSYTPPLTGVIAELLEEVPPPDPDFQAPPRPRRFVLPKLRDNLGGFGDRWAELPFRAHGRDFYIFLGVGGRASSTKVALVLRALDALAISAPPLSVTGA